MLAQVKNDYGQRLDYLYFTYRIASFDTHGNNMGTIGQSVFGRTANFPILEINRVIELIAAEYLSILKTLPKTGVI